MGVDIHSICQIKNEKGVWVALEKVPESFDCRNYLLFDVLNEIKTYGLPEEVRGNKYRYDKEFDYWVADFSEGYKYRYYGFGWITLADFQKYMVKENPYFVSVAFYDKFIELGGKFPEEMIEDKGDYNKIKFRVLDEFETEDLDTLLNIQKNFEEFAHSYNISNPEDIRIIFAFDR